MQTPSYAYGYISVQRFRNWNCITDRRTRSSQLCNEYLKSNNFALFIFCYHLFPFILSVLSFGYFLPAFISSNVPSPALLSPSLAQFISSLSYNALQTLIYFFSSPSSSSSSSSSCSMFSLHPPLHPLFTRYLIVTTSDIVLLLKVLLPSTHF